MMKKLKFCNAHWAIKNIMIILGAAVLCGCSTLSYTGNDFDKNNSKSITTSETFYFSTYTKNLSNVIKVTAGVSKSNVNEVLISYFEINNSGSADYVLNFNDVKFYGGTSPAGLILPENYISYYQGEQNEIYASTQNLTPTITNMVNVANNYQNPVESGRMAMEQNSNSASMRQINDVATGIRKHTFQTTSLIKSNEKKYYYFFIKDDGQYPITVEYKGLKYVFDNKKEKK